MKVLYVEHSINGHRKKYLENLLNHTESNIENLVVLVCPKIKVDIETNKEIKIINSNFTRKRDFIEYSKMITQIYTVAKENNVDIIHFLDGDLYYRFCGLFFDKLKEFKTIITFHHVYMYGWRFKAIARILKKITCGVVHTKFLKKTFNDKGIKNVFHIEYPVFNYDEVIKLDEKECKRFWELSENKCVISALGGTQKYKGVKVLLEALKNVDGNFILFIAGKEADYSEKYIKEVTKNYAEKVKIVLRTLTEKEYNYAVGASDIIALPYLKEFNGASGPLADSVVAEKIIVGSDYGSLGNLIDKNSIGYTFKCENADSLSKVLNNVLNKNDFKYDKKALQYKKELNPKIFVNKYLQLYNKL